MTASTRGHFLTVARPAILALLLLARPLPASAALGGDESSVQADRAHMRAALLRMTRGEKYTIHEMQAESGTVVREYVSTTGKVFAVAWEGPWLPDMQQVMGAYFDQYTQAVRDARAKRTGRGPLLIEVQGLIVQMGGRPRAFVGRAYIPEQVPGGVASAEIR